MQSQINFEETGFLASFRHKLSQCKNNQIQTRIQKQMAKKRKLLEIQQQLQLKSRKKSEEIVKKINKSIQVKNKKLKTIQQKFHQQLDYKQQKIKEHQKKEHQKMIKLWQESQKLSNSLLNNNFRQKSLRLESITPIKEMNEEETPHYQYEYKPQKSFSRANESKKMYQKYQSKDYLTKSMEKFQKSQRMQEQKKIEGVALKLHKIQKTRKNKWKIQEDNKKRLHQLMQFKELRKREEYQSNQEMFQKHKKSKTLGIEGGHFLSHRKDIQAHKWELKNKIRQDYLFQQRINKGENYLHKMRMKTEQHKVIKQLEEQSIQKKLYLERIKLSNVSLPPYSNRQSL